MPAVEPEFCVAGKIHEGTVSQALHPGRPEGIGDRGLAGVFAVSEVPQSRQNAARVQELVRTGQVRSGQIEKPVLVLKYQPTPFFDRVPVLTMHQQRSAEPRRLFLDDLQRLVVLRTHDAGHAALKDPRLLEGDFG